MLSLPFSQRTSVSWIGTPEPLPLLLDPLEDPEELPELDPEELPELLPEELPLDEPLEEVLEELGEQHPSPRAMTSHLRLSSKRLARPKVPAGTRSAEGHEQPEPDVDPRQR